MPLEFDSSSISNWSRNVPSSLWVSFWLLLLAVRNGNDILVATSSAADINPICQFSR
jgi:hypothetical protein